MLFKVNCRFQFINIFVCMYPSLSLIEFEVFMGKIVTEFIHIYRLCQCNNVNGRLLDLCTDDMNQVIHEFNALVKEDVYHPLLISLGCLFNALRIILIVQVAKAKANLVNLYQAVRATEWSLLNTCIDINEIYNSKYKT